jgi:hypothetical protein
VCDYTLFAEHSLTDDIVSVEGISIPLFERPDGTVGGGIVTPELIPVDTALHSRSLKKVFQYPASNLEITNVRIIEVAEPHIYGGILFNHFGHFLLESLGRLWPIHQPDLQAMPILYQPVWGVPDLNNKNHYIASSFIELGLDPKRVKICRELTFFRKMLVPRQFYGYPYLGNPDRKILDFFNRAGSHTQMPSVSEAKPRGVIYVSRSKLDIMLGRIVGEEEFEEYLRSQGIEVIYPEKMPFRSQIQHYREAEKIIFSEGSAIHSAVMLGAAKPVIAVVVRRPGFGGQFTTLLHALGLDAISIEEIERRDTCGLSDHMGVSVVDWLRVSKKLCDKGFTNSPFVTWPDLRLPAMRRHYQQLFDRCQGKPAFIRPTIPEIDY